MSNEPTRKPATRAVHAGRPTSTPDYRPTVTPIHPSATYHYPSMETLDMVFANEREGFVYARHGSPTVAALEEAAVALEEGEAALAFASGMAAIHVALLAAGARAGSAVVAAQHIYGATHALLDQLMRTQGVTVRFVDTSDLSRVEAACADLDPVALLVETISNPLLAVADLSSLAHIADHYGATFLVDNTFATPCLVRPLELGADIVIHSATKYLAGHGDVLGGIAVTSSRLRADMAEVLKMTGGNLGPYEAWLALRGIRTLTLRVKKHCDNAMQVARWLESHSAVDRVRYPGLSSHPQHQLSTRLFGKTGYGGMLAFEVREAGREEVFRFLESLEICVPATTLGDVQSLLLYPAHSSHRSLTEEERARIGIDRGLVRMSVGIEAPEDLVQDLEQALATLG